MAYIEKEPIIKFIENGLNNPDKLKAFGHDAVEILTEIEYAPVADVVEVKHGEWIVKNNEKDWKDQNSYRVDIKCSECGKSHFLGTTNFANEFNPDRLNKLGNYADYTFCGRCGAKMDKANINKYKSPLDIYREGGDY